MLEQGTRMGCSVFWRLTLANNKRETRPLVDDNLSSASTTIVQQLQVPQPHVSSFRKHLAVATVTLTENETAMQIGP